MTVNLADLEAARQAFAADTDAGMAMIDAMIEDMRREEERYDAYVGEAEAEALRLTLLRADYPGAEVEF